MNKKHNFISCLEQNNVKRRRLALVLCLSMSMGLFALPALAAESFSGSSTSVRLPQTYCGLQEHTHTKACYTSEKVLSCTLQEGEGHTHSAECYGLRKKLACSLQEGEGHTHSESCYSAVERLACELPEGEEHVHTPECYVTERILSCTLSEQPPHAHTAECYTDDVVYICGLENDPGHVHTNECISPDCLILLCGQTEQPPHAHTDKCYTTRSVMSCTLNEHKHSSLCYSTSAPVVENESDWLASVAPARLSGDWRHDLLAVAKTQLGYAPDGTNFITVGGETLFYTRYGDWYSDDPTLICSPWCAMFVSFCLYYAGIDALPYGCGCSDWLNDLRATDSGSYHPYGDGYTPQPGDIIFITYGRKAFREENARRLQYGFEPLSESEMKTPAEHVGILVSMNSRGFRTIEGNNGPVSYHNYSIGSGDQIGDEELILGYYSVPENPHYRSIQDYTGQCTISGDFPLTVRPYLREPTFAEYMTWEENSQGETLVLGWGVSLTEDRTPYTATGSMHYSFVFDQQFTGTVRVSYLSETGVELIPCTVNGNTVSFTTEKVGTFIFSRS